MVVDSSLKAFFINSCESSRLDFCTDLFGTAVETVGLVGKRCGLKDYARPPGRKNEK